MPTIEVDEQHLGSLKNTAALVQGMLRNPKTRRKVLEAYKEHVPNASVPELDMQNPIEQRLGGVEKAVIDFIEEQRKERSKEKTDRDLDTIRAQVETGRNMLKQRGYNENGIKELEAFRDAKGLIDYNDAVKLYELDHPAPQVMEPDSRITLFDFNSKSTEDDYFKRLMESQGEDTSAVNKMAHDTIAEMRGALPRR